MGRAEAGDDYRRGVFLVHGSGHNAAVWTDLASGLVAHCPPVALDLRGHGLSPAVSSTQ